MGREGQLSTNKVWDSRDHFSWFDLGMLYNEVIRNEKAQYPVHYV